MTEQLLLTIGEAANSLAIGRSRLYELLNQGLIKSVYLGRSRRIVPRELEAYVERLRDAQVQSDDEEGMMAQLTDPRMAAVVEAARALLAASGPWRVRSYGSGTEAPCSGSSLTEAKVCAIIDYVAAAWDGLHDALRALEPCDQPNDGVDRGVTMYDAAEPCGSTEDGPCERADCAHGQTEDF